MNFSQPLANITNLGLHPDNEAHDFQSVIKLKRDNYTVALRKQRNSEVLEAKRKKWNLKEQPNGQGVKGMPSSQVQ
jgi:hypothetical protein